VLASALHGRSTEAEPALAELEPFDPVALIEAAIERQDMAAARALAALLRRAGHPFGPLYAAALALEAGDEDAARKAADASPFPLACRPLGASLEAVLRLRAAGVLAYARDRNGVLVGAVSKDGRVEPMPEVEPLVRPLLEGSSRAVAPSTMPTRGAAGASGVRLAVDLDLSRLALEALAGRRGTIVLIEPRTGDVLAAVSDARTLAAAAAPALTERREPASIAKVLTTAAAYRAGIDADAEIARMTCRGVEYYGGKALWCPFPAGRLAGLDHALAVSCNVAFANLAVRLGSHRLLAEYRRWGFDAGADRLLGAAGRIEAEPRTLRELASLGVGLDLVDVTPLHAALLSAVVANQGRMPQPRTVVGRCGPLGLVDEPDPPSPATEVLPPALVPRLLQAMEAVADFGTAASLAPPGFRIAMKTGTAALPRHGYHVNYIGIGPLPEPTVAFCVRLTYLSSSPAATAAGRDVTRRLLASLAERRNALARAALRERALVGR
jgi:peptidoglycan glycosyltransferase